MSFNTIKTKTVYEYHSITASQELLTYEISKWASKNFRVHTLVPDSVRQGNFMVLFEKATEQEVWDDNNAVRM